MVSSMLDVSDAKAESSPPHSKVHTFRPHPLLRSGHLQTIYGAMVTGALPPYVATQHVIPLHDGESMVVHEELNAALPEDAPVAVLVHGLGGDHRSPYMRRIAHRLSQSGLRVWRVDLRGCGAGLPHAFKPAHAALARTWPPSSQPRSSALFVNQASPSPLIRSAVTSC